MPHDVRDQVVDFVRRWSEKTEIGVGRFSTRNAPASRKPPDSNARVAASKPREARSASRRDVLASIRSDVFISLYHGAWRTTDPVLIDVPMPIRTPRLTIRPKQIGDGAIAFCAVMETWQELNQWMRWAESRDSFTAESMEIRKRHVMASFLLRESIELIGIETPTGEAVVWCGFHDIDWQALQCDTGFWVRKTAQGRGIATETANAMVRYAFGALRIQRVGLTHWRGNEPSRRIAERLVSLYKGYSRGPICSQAARQ